MMTIHADKETVAPRIAPGACSVFPSLGGGKTNHSNERKDAKPVARYVLHGSREAVSTLVEFDLLGYSLEFEALIAQSTPHGHRPGPALSLWCTESSHGRGTDGPGGVSGYSRAWYRSVP